MKNKKILTALGLFILIEIYCNLYVARTTGVCSILYFLSGLLIAIIPLFTSEGAKSNQQKSKTHSLLAITWIIFLILFGIYFSCLFESNPLDYRLADMLPIMKIMSERFLEGEQVYKIIPEIWNGMQPIYLPAMWMPFVPAVLCEIDIRWVSLGAILLTTIFILPFEIYSYKQLSILAIPTMALFLGIAKVQPNIILYTEEGIVILYYMFLGWALMKKKPSCIALALTLCLFSRYSLAIWVVSYLGYLLYTKQYKAVRTLCLIGFPLGFFLMLSTGAIQYIDVFLGLQDNYIQAIIDQKEKYLPVIQRSLGLAKFVPYEQLLNFHRLFLITSIAVPPTLFIIYSKIKNNIPEPLFYLCSLKFTLVLFYNLLVMPYLYLFFVSTFLSLLLLRSCVERSW